MTLTEYMIAIAIELANKELSLLFEKAFAWATFVYMSVMGIIYLITEGKPKAKPPEFNIKVGLDVKDSGINPLWYADIYDSRESK